MAHGPIPKRKWGEPKSPHQANAFGQEMDPRAGNAWIAAGTIPNVDQETAAGERAFIAGVDGMPGPEARNLLGEGWWPPSLDPDDIREVVVLTQGIDRQVRLLFVPHWMPPENVEYRRAHKGFGEPVLEDARFWSALAMRIEREVAEGR